MAAAGHQVSDVGQLLLQYFYPPGLEAALSATGQQNQDPQEEARSSHQVLPS
jgi:hypothetical protein